MTTTPLPTNLRLLLAERELSEAAVARQLGLSTSAMSRRMSGEMEFRVSELQRIADMLNEPLAQLLAPRAAQAEATG